VENDRAAGGSAGGPIVFHPLFHPPARPQREPRSGRVAPTALEPVVWKLDLVTQFAAEEELRHERQPQQPQDEVTELYAERGPRGERRGELRRHSLLALQERRQPLLVAGEGRGVVAPATA